ncbi:MAG: hypothetical protein GY929_12050 [Actinomycetia bacterium]|nr:hypothetical protein [Actinomycetes bacterium]
MTAIRWSRVAFGVALLTGLLLAFAPLASTSVCEATPSGAEVCSSSRKSLAQDEGVGVAAVLFVPGLVTLVPVLRPSARSRVGAAVLLTVAAVVALASVGILLVPTLAVAWLAVAAERSVGLAPADPT